MAGAVCLRRRWSIATDDWSLLGPFSAFLHFLFTILVFHDLPRIAIFACVIGFFEIFLTVWSASGTIFDHEGKRGKLASFLGLRVILGVLQVPACMYACYISAKIISFVASFLALCLTLLLTFSIPVLSHPLMPEQGNDRDITAADDRARLVIPRPIQFLLRLFGAQHEHLTTIGALLLKLGEVDLTATDMISGLMLVEKPRDPPGRKLELDDPALELVKRFTAYSALSYGWPIEILSKYTAPNTTIPTCRILCILCNCARPPDNGLVDGDNYFRLNQACIEHFIKEREEKFGPCELVRACFRSKPGSRSAFGGTQPWIVMDDHFFKKRIITIRGTFGVEDALTDALVGMVPLHGGYVHEGMYLCADYLRLELEDEIKNAPYPILIIGHSLGGGIATCLGLMLKPAHPDLEVLAFSAPGCTISSSLSEATAEFITCVATQDDWVPRTSVASILQLQRHIQEKIKYTPYTKLKLWWTVVVRGKIPDTSVLGSTEDDQVFVCDTVTPGRVMHLRSGRTSMICCGLYNRQTDYHAYWINSRELNEIVVSAKAVEVHFLNIINDAVESLGECGRTVGRHSDMQGACSQAE